MNWSWVYGDSHVAAAGRRTDTARSGIWATRLTSAATNMTAVDRAHPPCAARRLHQKRGREDSIGSHSVRRPTKAHLWDGLRVCGANTGDGESGDGLFVPGRVRDHLVLDIIGARSWRRISWGRFIVWISHIGVILIAIGAGRRDWRRAGDRFSTARFSGGPLARADFHAVDSEFSATAAGRDRDRHPADAESGDLVKLDPVLERSGVFFCRALLA